MAASLTKPAFLPRAAAASFLQRAGWGAAAPAPLAGDASNRRYFRLQDRGRRAVLMDAPPPGEDVRPFVAVADLLLRHGFSAPRILAADEEQGFLLLEDFGDGVLGRLLAATPALEDEAYPLAIELLARLARVPAGGLAAYDRATLLLEAQLFFDWYLPAVGVAAPLESFVAALDSVWATVVAETAARPVVVLRDFHADNLMLLPDRSGLARLGLLDFQDALAGHPAYDLVSLLQDARRDVPARLEKAMLARYVRAAGVADATAFRAAYEVLGAQRNLKILGIFVRLERRDGKAGYTGRLPRVWGYLARNLRHPALAPLRDWLAAHLPDDRRAARWRHE